MSLPDSQISPELPSPPEPERDASAATPISSGRSRYRPRTSWLLPLLSIVFTIAALYWLARRNDGFSPAHFMVLLRTAHLPSLAAAAAFGLIAFLFRSLRWAVMIRPYAPKAPLADIYGSTLLGFAAVLVMGRPAELLRPFLIGRQIGSPFISQVGALFLERIYDLLAVLALGAWALSTADLQHIASDSALAVALRTGGGIVALAAAGATALLLVFTFASSFAIGRLRDALGFLPEEKQASANRLVESFGNSVSVSRNPLRFAQISGYTFVHWVTVGVSSWFVFAAFPESANIGMPDIFRFLALLALASAIPLPGLATAFFVVSSLLLTEWLRLPFETASAVTLGIWCAQLGITVPFGSLAALRMGLNWRKIKHMEQEAQL